MAFTQGEIDRIHADKKAQFGRIYKGPRNVAYVGTRSGSLKIESSLSGEVTGTTLRNVISNIGNYSREEIIEILGSVADKLDKEEFEDYKKEAKCFTIAMGIAL